MVQTSAQTPANALRWQSLGHMARCQDGGYGQLATRFEFMLTLACHWGCADCCRGLDKFQPRDSHVTVDQVQRFIQHLKDRGIFVRRLKVNGGDPVLNPDFEQIVHLFSAEVPKLFKTLKVQTAYPKRAMAAKFNLPKNLVLRCEPVDAKNFKSHHVPWFVSPAETGVIGPDDPPPFGSELTGKPCELQIRCGRSFERWGFTGCAQEGTLGRMLGIAPYSSVYRHWADPAICRHCPMCLGPVEAKKLQRRAMDGEVERVSRVFQAVDLRKTYDSMPSNFDPW